MIFWTSLIFLNHIYVNKSLNWQICLKIRISWFRFFIKKLFNLYQPVSDRKRFMWPLVTNSINSINNEYDVEFIKNILIIFLTLYGFRYLSHSNVKKPSSLILSFPFSSEIINSKNGYVIFVNKQNNRTIKANYNVTNEQTMQKVCFN